VSYASFQDLVDAAAPIGAILAQRGQTIAVSESSSGGLISAALLAVPGASRYFLGGGVVYTGPVRGAFLGLPERLPRAIRSSSEPYAALCAAAVSERLGATWGLAETGAAGPTGNRYGDAAGHTCVAIAGPKQSVMTLETEDSDRLANMYRFAGCAFEQLAARLAEV